MTPRISHHGPEKSSPFATLVRIGLICFILGPGLSGRPGPASANTSTDTCILCHDTFADTENAAQNHPKSMLETHALTRFDCTDCHRPVTGTHTRPRNCPVSEAKNLGRQYIQATCSRCHADAYDLTGADRLNQGKRLFRLRGCRACHPDPGIPASSKKFAPPLAGIRGKLKDRRWLPAWLKEPQTIRPGTFMPDFHMPEKTASDIAAFLFSFKDTHDYKKPDLSKASPTRGKRLFTDRGCLACHALFQNPETPPRRIPSLNDAGTKLKPEWILLELDDPRAYNPDAFIPLIDATPDEVNDIIAYLGSLTLDEAVLTASGNSFGSPVSGKTLVESYGCYACHRIPGFEREKIPGSKLSMRLAPFTAFESNITGPVCTQAPQALCRMPGFRLSDDDVRALATYMLREQPDPSDPNYAESSVVSPWDERGEAVLDDYGCRLCHRVEPGESPRVDSVIDRGHLLPPRLIGEGAKVQPRWLAAYLDKPFRMRIWMGMGMPYFYLSPEETETSVRFMRLRAGLDPEEPLTDTLPFDPRKMSDEEQALGEYRFRHDRCAQCHPASLHEGLPKGVSKDDLAIDLMLTQKRLRYEWVRAFLRNPDRYAGTGTRMPFIYFTPDGVPKVPSADQWLDRVARFLYRMESLPHPKPPGSDTRDVIDVNTFWENY